MDHFDVSPTPPGWLAGLLQAPLIHRDDTSGLCMPPKAAAVGGVPLLNERWRLCHELQKRRILVADLWKLDPEDGTKPSTGTDGS